MTRPTGCRRSGSHPSAGAGPRGSGAQATLVEDGPPVSDAELAPLKAWRRDRAEGKPAYTVATDATLREVVRRKPQTADELLSIKGIGPSFVTKHADSLLELLRAEARRAARPRSGHGAPARCAPCKSVLAQQALRLVGDAADRILRLAGGLVDLALVLQLLVRR